MTTPESTPPESPRRPADKDSGSDSHLNVAGMMIGTALMFIGFLNVFLSISGGFEIDHIPMVIYFSGIAVWANAVIENLTVRYSVMIVAVTLALAFVSYGEVLFWHKQVVFWTTIVIVIFFMFRTAAPDR